MNKPQKEFLMTLAGFVYVCLFLCSIIYMAMNAGILHSIPFFALLLAPFVWEYISLGKN